MWALHGSVDDFISWNQNPEENFVVWFVFIIFYGVYIKVTNYKCLASEIG